MDTTPSHETVPVAERPARRVRRSADERARLLDAFGESGLGREAFARKIGVSYQTLGLWLRRRAAAGKSGAVDAEAGSGGPHFARVQWEAPSGVSPSALTIELEAGVRLVMGAQFPLPIMVELIRQLRSRAPSC